MSLPRGQKARFKLDRAPTHRDVLPLHDDVIHLPDGLGLLVGHLPGSAGQKNKPRLALKENKF